MGRKLKKRSNRLFPEGIYAAEVTNVKVEPSKFDADKESITLELRTNYSEYGEAPWKAFMGCTFSLHPDSRFLPIAEKLLGRQIVDDEEIDTDMFVGKKCRVRMVHKQSEKSGRTFSNVAEVLSPEQA